MENQTIVRQGDLDHKRGPQLPFVIILDRLRSAHNVGNIFRIAESLQAEMICPCGYTACPPHPKLEKTAMGTENMVPYQHFATAAEAAIHFKNQGYQIVAVETVEGAESLWDASFEQKTAFILGNEALGIQEETLKVCDRFIELPVFGQKNSINVSNAAAATLFYAAKDLAKINNK